VGVHVIQCAARRLGCWAVNIDVTLADVATQRVIGRTVLDSEDLPANFDTGTSLQLGDGNQWTVVHATPPSREEYTSTGTLLLVLRKEEPARMVDPNSIGMSMSSICDELPVPGGSPAGRAVLTVKDDLWRDIELVGPGHDDDVEACFAGIRRVQAECRSGPGFTELHVRTEPRAPLSAVDLTLDELMSAFGVEPATVHPVMIAGSGAVVADGYSIEAATGVTIYGFTTSGRVSVAGIHRSGEAAASVTRPLAALMAKHGLSLVDWRSLLRISDEAALTEWLATEPQWLWR
jgi:hypothetical protein